MSIMHCVLQSGPPTSSTIRIHCARWNHKLSTVDCKTSAFLLYFNWNILLHEQNKNS